MNSKISGIQVAKNGFWKFSEVVGVRIIQVLLSIIIARLLGPEDFGVMAMVLIAVNFLNIFINSGVNAYIVYVDKISKNDFYTSIIFNLFLSGILCSFLFFMAKPISIYFEEPALVQYIYAMLLVIPFNAISSIYTSYAVKKSLFKSLFFRNLIAVPLSGIIGIFIAYSGGGVWSLVIQQIIYSLLLMIVIVFSIKIEGEGSYQFSFKSLKPMLSFGGFTLLSTGVAFISDNIADALIGKKINSSQLGYYNNGNKFPQVISSSINTVIASVIFSAFVSYREDFSELKDKCRKTYTLLSYLIFPVLCGLAVCAKPFVLFALTEKWMGSIPIIQLVCIYFCAIPYLQTISQLYLAIGKVKIRVWGEIVKMIFTISLLFIFINYGINAVAFSKVLVAVLMIGYTLIINKLMLDIRIRDFFKDLAKPAALTLVMCLCIYPLIFLPISPLFILLLQIFIGGGIYIFLLKIFKVEEYSYILNILLQRMK